MKNIYGILFILMMSTSSLFGNYFTILEPGYKEDYKYIYSSDKNSELIINYDDGKFEFNDDQSFDNSKSFQTFTQKNQGKLQTINSMSQVLKYGLLKQLKANQTIRVFDKGNYYFCKVKKGTEKFNSKIFNGSINTNVLEIVVKESISKSHNETDINMLAKFYYKNNIVVGFTLFADDDKITYTLNKIDSDNLEKFLDLKKDLKTVATYDDIEDETLSLIYKHNENNKQEMIKVTINKHPKKDTFTVVQIEGMSKILTYGSKINQKQTIFANIHTNSAFQVVGRFIDKSSKTIFKASPKKSMIKVSYGNNQKKQYTRNNKTPYYNLAGLWFIAPDPKKDSVMLFENTDNPKDFNLIQDSNSLEVQKNGNSFYSFKTEDGLVTSFDIALNNYHFTLVDATTPNVMINREKLNTFKQKFNIAEVK